MAGKFKWEDLADLVGASLGGTKYVQMRRDMIDQANREEEAKEEKKRRQRLDERESIQMLAELFRDAGSEQLEAAEGRVRPAESIPLMGMEGGGLTRDPSQAPQATPQTSGLGEGFEALIPSFVDPAVEGSQNRVVGGARSLALARERNEDREFEEETQRGITRGLAEREAFDPVDRANRVQTEKELGQVRIDLTQQEWDAMDDREKARMVFQEGLRHRYSMIEIAARKNLDEGTVPEAMQITIDNSAKGALPSIREAIAGGATPEEAVVDATQAVWERVSRTYRRNVPWDNVAGSVAYEARLAGYLGLDDEKEPETGASHRTQN